MPEYLYDCVFWWIEPVMIERPSSSPTTPVPGGLSPSTAAPALFWPGDTWDVSPTFVFSLSTSLCFRSVSYKNIYHLFYFVINLTIFYLENLVHSYLSIFFSNIILLNLSICPFFSDFFLLLDSDNLTAVFDNSPFSSLGLSYYLSTPSQKRTLFLLSFWNCVCMRTFLWCSHIWITIWLNKNFQVLNLFIPVFILFRICWTSWICGFMCHF